jgi:Uma2 family endonuclease
MAMTTVQRMTFNDLMAQPDDDYLNELVRGEILRMPPPKEDHGCVEAALVEAIGRYLDDRALALGWEKSQGRAARNRLVGRLLSGDVGVRFSLPDDPDQLRGLDVCYLSAEQVARLGAVPTAEYLVEMPALVAEVISPSETASYINEKVNDLLRGGAQMVWLFYPKTRTVMVLRPDGSARMIPAGGLLDGNDVLPGFAVELASIFA